jgi:hypothetical protein
MRSRVPLPAAVPSSSPCWLLVVAGYASAAAAQTPFVPYFGKNQIHYDKFEWHIYTTDHFEIYYYPELEQHLARVAGYASAYQQISADLKHDLGQDSADSVQDAQRVRGGERRSERAQEASARLPSRSACGWSCRSTIRPTSSTGLSSTS